MRWLIRCFDWRKNNEYQSLEKIKDNYPKYDATTDYLLQKRNGLNILISLSLWRIVKSFKPMLLYENNYNAYYINYKNKQ